MRDAERPAAAAAEDWLRVDAPCGGGLSRLWFWAEIMQAGSTCDGLAAPEPWWWF